MENIVALIGGLGGFASLVAVFFNYRKVKAEVQDIKANEATKLTRIALDLIEPTKKRIDDLEKELESSNKVIRELLRGVYILIDQIRRLGATPEYNLIYGDGDNAIEELKRRIELVKNGGGL